MKGIFQWLDKYIQKAEAALLIGSVLLIALNSIANVLGRYLFSQSIYFSEELNYFLIIAVTFIGCSYAARQSRHIRMTAFTDMLPKRIQTLANGIIYLLTAALVAVLTWYSWQYIGKVSQMGRLSPAMQVPLSWVYLIAPIGLFFSTVQFARVGSRHIKRFITLTKLSRSSRPDGVGSATKQEKAL
ncbi:TRAP transporter small permease [Vibrio diabolicus]|jgi:TRAP-type C4-dicarboxylate transport system permease small subunit|uniref:TRAP transporter small permease protein n=1 Tax=Vibrio diabolicus TaxID=50719 RepID=A0AA92R979_9VIBR|nr:MULTISPECIES: TRAP transporter small permease [Vibrio diabolicus subgroup]GAJ74907.1 LOW QUALITY PROTEIN: TRAP-type transport system, small permease component, predicted N-acetylneuraminate transporter [Vibrio sp. JCM 18905]AVF61380.1 TRAP transporter small permease [Vibrio diabolicus]MCE3219714.1 TRAP transporter small permease [Vibrio diabolicus]MCG6242844.1 TRAP transporter small permease [Vibrio diabolicus]MCR9548692.1 TRAP transporter small permease [Vibrio antiquarius]